MEIIKIELNQIGVEAVNSVNSREIYEYLEVETRYNDWIQRAIEKYDFEENIDYSKMSNGTSRGIDYIVTMDMAKELCMVSNTEKGRETRKYFIQKEKEASKPKVLTLEDLVYQSSLLVQQRLEEQEQKINNIEIQMKDSVNKVIESSTKLLEHTANKEVKPQAGYVSRKNLRKRFGYSVDVLIELADAMSVDTCEAIKVVDGIESPYTAYKLSDMVNAIDYLETTMVLSNSGKTYTHPMITGRFKKL